MTYDNILPDITTEEAGEQPSAGQQPRVTTPQEATPQEATGPAPTPHWPSQEPAEAGDQEPAEAGDASQGSSDHAVHDPADSPTQQDDGEDEPDIADPGKLMRLGHMHAKILEELKGAETDPAGRKRLAALHEETIEAMKETLGSDLEAELIRFSPKLSSYATPSHSELVIAQAGLVGWIEGLMQSIQTAIMARQAMAGEGNGHPAEEHAPGPQGAKQPGTYGPGNYL